MDERARLPERRLFRRADVSRPVRIELLAPSDRSPVAEIEGETQNIGCGGISAKISGVVIPGSACRVRIYDHSGDTELDEIEGEVRWTQALDHGSCIGVKFGTRLDVMRCPRPVEEISESSTQLSQRVLVADDEPVIRDLLGRFLSRIGCEVETASSGEEVLEAVRRARPDVVLLDLRMPGMSGLEVLERIRGENLAVGVIWAISGYASDQEAERAMQLGATDFINKPLDLQYLEWSLNMNQMAD